jgi:hypothetical protein
MPKAEKANKTYSKFSGKTIVPHVKKCKTNPQGKSIG